jgi:mannose-6-phosphate isomerase-like protein (cupin superfamily)
MQTHLDYTLVNREELSHDGNAYEFQGIQYEDTDVSFIWVDMPPGGMVRLHKHPYPEIFIIQQGVATFTIGSTTLEAHTGQIVIVPADTPHKFMNASHSRLKQIDIHVSRQFLTHWLEDEA